MTGKQLQSGFAKSELVLHTGFLFWPVKSVQERGGWLCGLYESLQTLPHRELLAKGRLVRKHHRPALKGEEVAAIEITDSEVRNSFLWHENLGAALEAQRVLYETSQLDEQQYCEPRALVYGERAEEALLEFINLEAGNILQAVDFIKKFGEFDLLELNVDDPGFSSLPQEVQRFCSECLRERQDPFAVPLDQFWETHADILELWTFADSLADRKMDAVREECKRRRPTSEFSGEPDWLAVGKAVLSADLSSSLNLSSPRPPRLLLHDRDGQFIALTLCRTMRSSLYVQLLTAIVSRKNHRQCLNCGAYFTPRVESQNYCKSRCQNIAKVRRSRAKKDELGEKNRKQSRSRTKSRRAGAATPTRR